jgi:hypothetical protein
MNPSTSSRYAYVVLILSALVLLAVGAILAFADYERWLGKLVGETPAIISALRGTTPLDMA